MRTNTDSCEYKWTSMFAEHGAKTCELLPKGHSIKTESFHRTIESVRSPIKSVDTLDKAPKNRFLGYICECVQLSSKSFVDQQFPFDSSEEKENISEKANRYYNRHVVEKYQEVTIAWLTPSDRRLGGIGGRAEKGGEQLWAGEWEKIGKFL